MAHGGDQDSKDQQLLQISPVGIWVLSLLNEYRLPQVRADFVNGLILPNDSSEHELPALLKGIDALRRSILPPWHSVYDQSVCEQALENLRALLNKSTDIFNPKNDYIVKENFKFWALLVQAIAEGDYWKTRKSNILGIDGNVDEGCLAAKMGNGFQPQQNGSDFFKNENRSKPAPIVLDESTDCEFGLYGDSEDEEFDFNNGQNPMNSNMFTNNSNANVMMYPKEVVKPPVYRVDCNVHLASFLRSFEKYFDGKFINNSSKAKTQELINFLPPELLEVYDSLGGGFQKYSVMKEELLKWYNSNLATNKRHWQRVLHTSTMKPNETLAVYGIRLQQYAMNAYPDSPEECLKELRHRYVNTVPEWFRVKMEMLEDCREQFGKPNRLTWKERMNLAQKEDKRHRSGNRSNIVSSQFMDAPNTSNIWYNNAPTCNSDNKNQMTNPSNSNNNTRGKGRKSKMYYNNQNRNNNHVKNTQQNTSTTPQNTSTNQQAKNVNSNNNNSVRPKELNNQRQNRRNGTFCNWCGKYSHSEDECWRKSGACLLCGSMDHVMTSCSLFRSQASQSVPIPVCSNCQGNHLGKDCPSLQANDTVNNSGNSMNLN